MDEAEQLCDRLGGRDHARRPPDQTVVLTGGVRTPSDALVGPVAVGRRSLHLDMLFLGVHGMSERPDTTRT